MACYAAGAAGGSRARRYLGADFAPMRPRFAARSRGLHVEGFAALPTYTRANSLSDNICSSTTAVRDKLWSAQCRRYDDIAARSLYGGGDVRHLDPREVDGEGESRQDRGAVSRSGLVRSLLFGSLRDAMMREGGARQEPVAMRR